MAPKVVTALEPDPSQITWLQRMAGGACLIVFVSTWLLSLASPFVLVWSLVRQNYIVTAVIVVVTAAAYLPWKPGFLAQSVRHVIKTYTPCYFQSIVMAFEGDRDSNTPLPCAKTDPQTFYAIHPHGAFCVGWAMLYCHDVMQHVKFCFAPALYASPFFRLFARLTGRPGSAAKASMMDYMKRGESIALTPGGFEEATLTSTTVDRVFIQKRTGFIRLCLQYGIRVRPVYVFGEKGFFWKRPRHVSHALGLESLWHSRPDTVGIHVPAPLAPRQCRHAHCGGTTAGIAPNRSSHQARRETLA